MAFLSFLGYCHFLLFASNIRLNLTKSEGSAFTDIFCKHFLSSRGSFLCVPARQGAQTHSRSPSAYVHIPDERPDFLCLLLCILLLKVPSEWDWQCPIIQSLRGQTIMTALPWILTSSLKVNWILHWSLICHLSSQATQVHQSYGWFFYPTQCSAQWCFIITMSCDPGEKKKGKLGLKPHCGSLSFWGRSQLETMLRMLEDKSSSRFLSAFHFR